MGPEEYLKELVTTMKKFQEENILCDTVLTTDDRELWAHSVVLAAASPFLCSTFKDLCGAKAKKIRYNVSLPGCSSSAVEMVLQFLYTGQLAMPSAYQQAEEFARILFVFKSLGINVGKLHGARVTFEGSSERNVSSLNQLIDKESVASQDNNSGCLEMDKQEFTNSLAPSTADNCTSDLNPVCLQASLSNDQEATRLLTPLLSVTLPVTSRRATGLLWNDDEKNGFTSALNQNMVLRSSSKLATKKNSGNGFQVKSGSCQEPRIKHQMTRVILKAVRNNGNNLLINTIDHSSKSENPSQEEQDVKVDIEFPPILEDEIQQNSDIAKTDSEAYNKVEELTWAEEDEGNQKKLYTCLTCCKKFLRRRCFEKHIQSHSSGSISHICDKCGKVTPSITALKVHQKTHVDGFPHVCEVCGKGYKFKRYLLVHMMAHTGTKPYLCDSCGRGFYVVTNLKRHVQMWHTSHRPHVCRHCGKGFITRPRLIKHEETHTGDRLYSCDTCGSSFTNAGNLSRHKLLHTGKKPFVCPVCLRGFTQKVTMQSHLTTHADQRATCVCQICKKGLSKLSNLRKHMQMHSQHKPHVCEICGKRFAIKEYLTRHATIHKEKRHVCETCGKAYRSDKFLVMHSKTHVVSSCGKCGKEFVGTRALNTHMRVHLDEGGYQCKVCGKSFSLTSQLEDHSKTHMDDNC